MLENKYLNLKISNSHLRTNFSKFQIKIRFFRPLGKKMRKFSFFQSKHFQSEWFSIPIFFQYNKTVFPPLMQWHSGRRSALGARDPSSFLFFPSSFYRIDNDHLPSFSRASSTLLGLPKLCRCCRAGKSDMHPMHHYIHQAWIQAAELAFV